MEDKIKFKLNLKEWWMKWSKIISLREMVKSMK
jgi:hypothetical protein